MASVLAQVFTDIVMEKYRDGNAAVLAELTPFDHLVQYNKINLTEIGSDPSVVVDNTTWPLTPAQRTDTGIDISLATFDTVPTHITNVEELETNYDKAKSVLNQHVQAILAKATQSALYNIAPAGTANVIETKATAIKYNDILALRTQFNKANLPEDGRVLILAPDHEEALLAEDADRYNQMMTSGKLAGFKVLTSTGLPTYTAKAKLSVGDSSGKTASIAFLKSEVMRAMGDIDVRTEDRWADYRGWLIGAQMRFVALPIKTTAVFALVDKTTGA